MDQAQLQDLLGIGVVGQTLDDDNIHNELSLRNEPLWSLFKLPQVVVAALVYLSVLAWVEVVFFDLRNGSNKDSDPVQGIFNTLLACQGFDQQGRKNAIMYALILSTVTLIAIFALGYFLKTRQKCKTI
jgi:hypothetical protein